MPIQYPAGIVAEHRSVRNDAGLFDLSHMGEFFFRGDGALAAVDRLVSSDIAGLEVGQARYGLLCNEGGTIVDDVISYRTAQDEVLMVVNASNVEKDAQHVKRYLPKDVEFEDASLETALIAVQGPRASVILSSVTDLEVRESSIEALPPFGVTRGRVGGVRATIARTGYTGEDGFEVFAPWDRAASPWNRLLAAGAGMGITPIGLGARDTLRLEARLSLYGNEIDETTHPLEAGLAWVVKMDKGDFVGRAALAEIKAAGLVRKLVGFEMTGRGIARHGYPLTDPSGQHVGTVTSGSPGPTVGKNIGLGYVPVSLSEIGTKLGVEIRGKVVEAVVVKTPFYKRAK